MIGLIVSVPKDSEYVVTNTPTSTPIATAEPTPQDVEQTLQIEVIKNYGEIPLVECLPAQLNQVFMNLLSNAIDAIEESVTNAKQAAGQAEAAEPVTKIWIDTRTDGADWVEICIRDSGKGIPDDSKEKLFDYFFTTKPIGKGTGLGLAISYDIVNQKHAGDLSCKTHPEGGAEFTVRLPVKFHSPT